MNSTTGVITYPIPAYQNLPIQSQFYIPGRYVISSILLGVTTLVTTSVNHSYVIGQEVRLIIPNSFGSYQLNEKKGFVLSIPNLNQVNISIDSSVNVDAFINSTASTVAQILAIGDVNTGVTNTQGRMNNLTFIPGSFLDISPL